MKKAITIVAALALTAALSLPAFAETIIDQDASDPKTGSINLTYTVDPSYTVTIPETVALGEAATIKAENIVIDKGQHLVVMLTGASVQDNAFTVKTAEGAELPYTITTGELPGDPVAADDIVLMVNPEYGDTGSVKLNFIAPEDATIIYSGAYTSTVTFTVVLMA